MSLAMVYAAMWQKEQAGNTKLLERVYAMIREHRGYQTLPPGIRFMLKRGATLSEGAREEGGVLDAQG